MEDFFITFFKVMAFIYSVIIGVDIDETVGFMGVRSQNRAYFST